MSAGQYSKTSRRVKGPSSQTARPERVSTMTARCRRLTRIGDLPGMNHVVARSRQCAFGRSPLARHTSTRATWGGSGRGRSPGSSPCPRIASTTLKNSGAAILTPTSAGLPAPSKFPTHTTRA